MTTDPAIRPRLHIIKLSVGSQSVAGLREWQAERMEQRREQGLDPRPRHVTRMKPRRGEEVLQGGSIYWVIQGFVAARQAMAAIEPVTGEDGINRCALIMTPELIEVEPRPKRPFQGWRYLEPRDAPPDLFGAGAGDEPPAALRAALDALGLPSGRGE